MTKVYSNDDDDPRVSPITQLDELEGGGLFDVSGVDDSEWNKWEGASCNHLFCTESPFCLVGASTPDHVTECRTIIKKDVVGMYRGGGHDEDLSPTPAIASVATNAINNYLKPAGPADPHAPPPRPRSWACGPVTKFTAVWDSAMALLLAFTATVTPFEIGFLEPDLVGAFSLEGQGVVFWGNRCADVGFALDLLVNLNRVYVNQSAVSSVARARPP